MIRSFQRRDSFRLRWREKVSNPTFLQCFPRFVIDFCLLDLILFTDRVQLEQLEFTTYDPDESH